MNENTEHTDDLPGGIYADLRTELARRRASAPEGAAGEAPGGYIDDIRAELARRQAAQAAGLQDAHARRPVKPLRQDDAEEVAPARGSGFRQVRGSRVACIVRLRDGADPGRVRQEIAARAVRKSYHDGVFYLDIYPDPDATHNPDFHAECDADGDARPGERNADTEPDADAPALGDAAALDHSGADAHAGGGDCGASAAYAGGRPTLALQFWGAGRGGSETP